MKNIILVTICFIAIMGFSTNICYADTSPEYPSAVVETVIEIPTPEAATAEPGTEVIEPAPAEGNETSEAPAPAETTDLTLVIEPQENQEKDAGYFTVGFVWNLVWLLFTALMLAACVRTELDTANKLIWVMLILLTGGVGTLIYCILFLGKMPKNLFNTKEGAKLGLGEGFEICMDGKKVKSLGVCAGLAEYVGWKPEYMRILMVALALFEWEIILAYGIFYYILANAAKQES